MTASLQWLCACRTCGIVRVHADGGTLGDPYTWGAAFHAEGDAAVVCGAIRAPTPGETRAALAAARMAGFRRVRWERRRGRGVEARGLEL